MTDAEGGHCIKVDGKELEGDEDTLTSSANLRDDPYSFPLTLPSNVTPPKDKLRRTPRGSVEVVWNLKNLEPSEDVRFAYETALGVRRAIRTSIAKLARRSAGRAELENARDTLLALCGIRLDDPAAQARIAKRNWYVEDPTMKRSRLLALDPLLGRLESRLQP